MGGERQHRVSGSHSGSAAAFAVSREQEADCNKKGEDLACPTVMYTSRKEVPRRALLLTLLPGCFTERLLLATASASSRGYTVRDCLLQPTEPQESPGWCTRLDTHPGVTAAVLQPLPARDAATGSTVVNN